MSFDERMVHYRQKYSGAAQSPESSALPTARSEASGGAAPAGAAPRKSGSRRKRGGERPGIQAAGDGRQQGRKRRDRGHDRTAAGNAGNDATRQKAGADRAGPPKGGQKDAVAPKKGILSRIAGLFRKKPE
jgi:hypothetical protein